MKNVFPYLFILVFICGCGNNEMNTGDAINSINKEDIAGDIQILASDEFMGRQPSHEGEEKTINYLKAEFQKLGLKPGNNGSFFQEVPLVELITGVPAELNRQVTLGKL